MIYLFFKASPIRSVVLTQNHREVQACDLAATLPLRVPHPAIYLGFRSFQAPSEDRGASMLDGNTSIPADPCPKSETRTLWIICPVGLFDDPR